jgi:hypothetical protein
MPVLDLGQEVPAHLRMVLTNALHLYGFNADVYRAVLVENLYSELDDAHDYDPSNVATGKCKILCSQPMEGLILSDFIQLKDVTSELIITTLAKLQVNDQVVVKSPDGNIFNIRITETFAYAALSKVAYKFKGVMT